MHVILNTETFTLSLCSYMASKFWRDGRICFWLRKFGNDGCRWLPYACRVQQDIPGNGSWLLGFQAADNRGKTCTVMETETMWSFYIHLNHFKTFRGMECTDSGEQCSRLWDCKTVEFWHGKGVRFGRPRAGPEARRRCTVKILRSSMNVRELWQRGNGCLQEYVIFSLRLIVQLATAQHERLQTHKFISWFSKAMSCPISLESSVIRMVSDAGFAGCW